MILVTGATGGFGKASIDSLLKKGIPANKILALVRAESSTEEFKKKGLATVVADYNDYQSLLHAFKSVEKLLFISGNELKNRLSQHQQVIQAAKESGVKHIIYTSFQRKEESPSSALWLVAASHIQTEKWIKESGMDYTILRNNLYMDFLPSFIGEKVLETGIIFVPAGNGKITAVLRSEMAEAAASILSSNGHQGKEYDFTNVEAVSYEEIAQIITKTSGKTIKYLAPSVEEYKQVLTSYGLASELIELFSSFALAQANGELDKQSDDLEKLLGRKPLSISDFLSNLYTLKV